MLGNVRKRPEATLPQDGTLQRCPGKPASTGGTGPSVHGAHVPRGAARPQSPFMPKGADARRLVYS